MTQLGLFDELHRTADAEREKRLAQKDNARDADRRAERLAAAAALANQAPPTPDAGRLFHSISPASEEDQIAAQQDVIAEGIAEAWKQEIERRLEREGSGR